jgi:hypothetical protein
LTHYRDGGSPPLTPPAVSTNGAPGASATRAWGVRSAGQSHDQGRGPAHRSQHRQAARLAEDRASITGYRAPYWEFSESTLDLVEEAGFFYDSSMMARDLTPYRIQRWQVNWEKASVAGPASKVLRSSLSILCPRKGSGSPLASRSPRHGWTMRMTRERWRYRTFAGSRLPPRTLRLARNPLGGKNRQRGCLRSCPKLRRDTRRWLILAALIPNKDGPPALSWCLVPVSDPFDDRIRISAVARSRANLHGMATRHPERALRRAASTVRGLGRGQPTFCRELSSDQHSIPRLHGSPARTGTACAARNHCALLTADTANGSRPVLNPHADSAESADEFRDLSRSDQD